MNSKIQIVRVLVAMAPSSRWIVLETKMLLLLLFCTSHFQNSSWELVSAEHTEAPGDSNLLVHSGIKDKQDNFASLVPLPLHDAVHSETFESLEEHSNRNLNILGPEKRGREQMKGDEKSGMSTIGRKRSALEQNLNEDFLALLAFKAIILSDPLGALSSWKTLDTTPCLNWTGVICNSMGRVVCLYLDSMHLRGSIAPELGNLTMLRFLDLGNNFLTGFIPATLSRLDQLQVLNLGNNRLQGRIPSQLAYLSSIQNLDLSLNNLSGLIPPNLGFNSTPLYSISMNSNLLTGSIPESLANSTSLSFLNLSSNNLDGNIPSSFGRNTVSLQNLLLGRNQLTGFIPPVLGYATFLAELNVAVNKLEGSIPETIVNCSNLHLVDASRNSLSGVLPYRIGELQKLQILSLNNARLSGAIPESLGNCSLLQFLDLSYLDQLSGEIPFATGALTNLSFLFLVSNNLTGRIPDSIGGLKNLVALDLSHNSLHGDIPSSLGNLSHIKLLQLAGNRLTGAVPDALFALPLQTVNLGGNELTQLFPIQATITNISESLQFLGAGYNSITQAVPFWIGKLIRLSTLSLPHNYFKGPIPAELSNCSQLEILDLSSNLLSGKLPDELTLFKGIRLLLLHVNNISGTISVWIGSLPLLQILDLSQNSFSGPIAPDLSMLQSFIQPSAVFASNSSQDDGYDVYIVNPDVHVLPGFECICLCVSNGNFENLEGLGQVYDYEMAYNLSVSGSSLGGYGILEGNGTVVMDLSSNFLTGTIPPHLAALRGMIELNLSGNSLTGGIPEGFGNLAQLEVLDLSNNQLIGPIPFKLTGLYQLEVLELANNNLSGCIPTLNQFSTFQNSSFSPGNPFLQSCLPLSHAPMLRQSRRPEAFMSIPAFSIGVGWGFIVTFAALLSRDPG